MEPWERDSEGERRIHFSLVDIFIWCQSLETFHIQICWSGVSRLATLWVHLASFPGLPRCLPHSFGFKSRCWSLCACRLISDPACGDLPFPRRVDESPDVAGKGTTMYCLSAILFVLSIIRCHTLHSTLKVHVHVYIPKVSFLVYITLLITMKVYITLETVLAILHAYING